MLRSSKCGLWHGCRIIDIRRMWTQRIPKEFTVAWNFYIDSSSFTPSTALGCDWGFVQPPRVCTLWISIKSQIPTTPKGVISPRPTLSERYFSGCLSKFMFYKQNLFFALPLWGFTKNSYRLGRCGEVGTSDGDWEISLITSFTLSCTLFPSLPFPSIITTILFHFLHI